MSADPRIFPVDAPELSAKKDATLDKRVSTLEAWGGSSTGGTGGTGRTGPQGSPGPPGPSGAGAYAPGQMFEATLDGAPTGLTGTMRVSMLDNVGAVILAPSTTGIIETPAGSGHYAVPLQAPGIVGQYSILWDNGSPSPSTTASEDILVLNFGSNTWGVATNTLPTTPLDGQVTHYIAQVSPRVVWTLKYNGTPGATYPWDFVGGPPLYARIEASEGTNSTSPTDLTTVGPTLIVPRTGDYEISWGANAGYVSDTAPGSAGYGSLCFVNLNIAGAHVEGAYWGNSAGLGQLTDAGSVGMSRPTPGLTALTVVKLTYHVAWTSGVHSGIFGARWLRITPWSVI